MNKINSNNLNLGQRVLADGILISNNTRDTGLNNNDLIIGSSGADKTGGYVIPNLQNLNGSLVVSDTKGLLQRMFEKTLLQKGYNVYTIDLVNPEQSYGYNPLSSIRKYDDGSFYEQDILTLANTLIPTLCHDDPFWEQAAAGYVAFLISYCLEVMDERDHNLLTVTALHSQFGNPKCRALFKEKLQNKDCFAAKKYYTMEASLAADKTWSSIFEVTNRALEKFTFKEAAYIFNNNNNFDIRSLSKEKTVLFLNVSDTNRTFDNFVNIFYSQALQLLCDEANKNPDGRLDVPVRIIMDDFATSAKIPDFDKIISVIRSREISVSLILQSISQLESLYGKNCATTIINNCDHLLYLGGQDLDTANFISHRAFKLPEDILCMPRNKAYLITNGKKAELVTKVSPYSTLSLSNNVASYEK